MEFDVRSDLAAILHALGRKGVPISGNDAEIALKMAVELNHVSESSTLRHPPGMANMELVTIYSSRKRARSQKITNMTWELDKNLFEFFRNASLAGFGTTGLAMAASAVTGAAALTAPVIILPAVAVASVAAGLRWSGRLPVPIRAAYILYHAWKLSEYQPEGHEVAVADLIGDIPVMLKDYPIEELNRAKLVEDLNHLIGSRCLEPIPLRSGAGAVSIDERRLRLLEKVRLKKTKREFL
jgi:hypothetical protein